MASSTTGSTLSFIWTSVELSRDTRGPEPDPLGKQHPPHFLGLLGLAHGWYVAGLGIGPSPTERRRR
jgi:hypothetical protein